MTIPSTSDHSAKWSAPGAGAHYAGKRWRNARAEGRDGRLIARLLQRQNLAVGASVLDAPCGTGRLERVLTERSARYVGLDISADMLGRFAAARVQASAWQMPFADGRFDTVVCCRLLHHVAETAPREALLRELVRVARRFVVVSFWDAQSLHAWRRRKGLRSASHRDARVALRRGELEGLLARAGAEVLDYAHSLRLISQQAFVLARKTESVADPA